MCAAARRGCSAGPGGAAYANIAYEVTTEQEIRRAVQTEAARKVNAIKIWVDDRNGRIKTLPPDIYRVIAEEADRYKVPVGVHNVTLRDAKELLRAGLLHGDVMTVTGKTLAENLAGVKHLEDLPKQDIVRPVNNPIAPANNHISVLKGNLAPESCVLKLSGKTLEKGVFRGTARVFDSEADTMKAIRAGDIKPGTVIVVRNVGPVGGPGMPEMVMLTIQLQGRGLAEDVALITDGRFSGVSHGILIGHISPEAARGGPIAAVRDGDTIVIDPKARTLNAELSDAQIAERMKDWKAPDLRARVRPGSVHDKYVRLVSSAHHGCVV